MKTDYENEAARFLMETGTTIKMEYHDYAPYFDDDKESRDIYRVTLRRDGKVFSFRFGQSIVNVGKVPTAYDVLACLTKSYPGTFEDFCQEIGANAASRRVKKTYKAVVREFRGVYRLFADVIDDLQEIQ